MMNTHIETILVVTGLATALAIVLCVAPRRILRFAFGLETPQPVTLLMASHWGLLVFFGNMPRIARVKALAVIDTGIALLYLLYFAGL